MPTSQTLFVSILGLIGVVSLLQGCDVGPLPTNQTRSPETPTNETYIPTPSPTVAPTDEMLRTTTTTTTILAGTVEPTPAPTERSLNNGFLMQAFDQIRKYLPPEVEANVQEIVKQLEATLAQKGASVSVDDVTAVFDDLKKYVPPEVEADVVAKLGQLPKSDDVKAVLDNLVASLPADVRADIQKIVEHLDTLMMKVMKGERILPDQPFHPVAILKAILDNLVKLLPAEIKAGAEEIVEQLDKLMIKVRTGERILPDEPFHPKVILKAILNNLVTLLPAEVQAGVQEIVEQLDKLLMKVMVGERILPDEPFHPMAILNNLVTLLPAEVKAGVKEIMEQYQAWFVMLMQGFKATLDNLMASLPAEVKVGVQEIVDELEATSGKLMKGERVNPDEVRAVLDNLVASLPAEVKAAVQEIVEQLETALGELMKGADDKKVMLDNLMASLPAEVKAGVQEVVEQLKVTLGKTKGEKSPEWTLVSTSGVAYSGSGIGGAVHVVHSAPGPMSFLPAEVKAVVQKIVEKMEATLGKLAKGARISVDDVMVEIDNLRRFLPAESSKKNTDWTLVSTSGVAYSGVGGVAHSSPSPMSSLPAEVEAVVREIVEKLKATLAKGERISVNDITAELDNLRRFLPAP